MTIVAKNAIYHSIRDQISIGTFAIAYFSLCPITHRSIDALHLIGCTWEHQPYEKKSKNRKDYKKPCDGHKCCRRIFGKSNCLQRNIWPFRSLPYGPRRQQNSCIIIQQIMPKNL